MYSAFNTLSESYFYILKLQNRSFVTNFARRAEKEYLFFLFQRGSPAPSALKISTSSPSVKHEENKRLRWSPWTKNVICSGKMQMKLKKK